jgi:hypothetical protein
VPISCGLIQSQVSPGCKRLHFAVTDHQDLIGYSHRLLFCLDTLLSAGTSAPETSAFYVPRWRIARNTRRRYRLPLHVRPRRRLPTFVVPRT